MERAFALFDLVYPTHFQDFVWVELMYLNFKYISLTEQKKFGLGCYLFWLS